MLAWSAGLSLELEAYQRPWRLVAITIRANTQPQASSTARPSQGNRGAGYAGGDQGKCPEDDYEQIGAVNAIGAVIRLGEARDSRHGGRVLDWNGISRLFSKYVDGCLTRYIVASERTASDCVSVGDRWISSKTVDLGLYHRGGCRHSVFSDRCDGRIRG
jgi:hypothetical protein